MLKVIMSAILALGIGAFAFAEGNEETPAPTGTEAPVAPKAEKAEKPMKAKHMHKKAKKHTADKAE